MTKKTNNTESKQAGKKPGLVAASPADSRTAPLRSALSAPETTAESNRENSAQDAGVSQRANALVPETTAESIREEWEQAGIGNAFIFGKVMSSNPDLLLELLQHAMPEMQIRSVHNLSRETDIKLSIDAHGIRLDVSAKDNAGRIINIEMQLKDEKNIPRRMRYYSGAIDQTILGTGMNYSALTETVLLFITLFDPFGKDRIRYSFRNICLEDRGLELQDGTTKIVLNAVGTKGDVSAELKGFLDLVARAPKTEKGSFADRVQNQVIIARKNSEWRRQYMEWKMTLLNERTKGREEGRIEGREEGRIEGREEGREEGTLLNQIAITTRKVKKGADLSAIAEALEMDKEEVRPIWEAVVAAAPEYDREQILGVITSGKR